jgi:hypothetical protein
MGEERPTTVGYVSNILKMAASIAVIMEALSTSETSIICYQTI